jgi:hypothetical protein
VTTLFSDFLAYVRHISFCQHHGKNVLVAHERCITRMILGTIFEMTFRRYKVAFQRLQHLLSWNASRSSVADLQVSRASIAFARAYGYNVLQSGLVLGLQKRSRTVRTRFIARPSINQAPSLKLIVLSTATRTVLRRGYTKQSSISQAAYGPIVMPQRLMSNYVLASFENSRKATVIRKVVPCRPHDERLTFQRKETDLKAVFRNLFLPAT